MAALPEKVQDKNSNSVKICLAIPVLAFKECPLFSFMGIECNFRLVLQNINGTFCYSAYIAMDDTNSKIEIKSFTFSHLVEVVNGMDVTRLYKEKCTTIYNTNATYRFLQIPEEDLLDYLSSSSNSAGCDILNFSFTIFLTNDYVKKFKIKSYDKSVQTGSYLNADTSMECLSKDFTELLYSGLNHDVEIKCGERTVKVHKNILCARSTVFNTMLQSDFLEGQTGVIEIKDMDSSSFLDFIKFIYTDILPKLTPAKAMSLYETGDKYDIKSLSKRCSEYLQDYLSVENACLCLALADAHSDKILKSKAMAYILRKKLFLLEEHWLPFCDSYPKIAVEVYRLHHKISES